MDKSLSFSTLVQPKAQAGTSSSKAAAADPSFDFLSMQASSPPPPPPPPLPVECTRDNYRPRSARRGSNGPRGRMSVDSRQVVGPGGAGRRSLDSGTGTDTGRRAFGQVATEEKKKSQGGFLGVMFSGCRECRADDPGLTNIRLG